MKELFPFLIFAAIAIFNVIAAAQKKAKENKPAEPTLRRDEIPPELRRRLYGDVEENIPTARPRSDAPQRRVPPQVPIAPPRRDQPEPVRAPYAMPSREEVVREQRGDFEDMGRFDPTQSLEDSPTVYETPAPRRQPPPPPAPRPVPRPQPVAQAPQRRAQRPAQRPPQPMPQRPTPQVQPMEMAQEPEMREQSPRLQAPAAPAAAPMGLAQLFATRSDLRRAILAQEILGTPRSNQAYDYQ